MPQKTLFTPFLSSFVRKFGIMLQKTKGIVLHVLKYADASLIVDVYTERFGRLAFSVRMSKSKRSQVRTSLFQPLALLDMEIDYKPNRQLQRVQSMASEYPYSTIPYNPVKSTIAMYLSEVLYRIIREQVSDERLFSYLYYSLLWLDRAERGIANFHLVFMMRLSRFLGIYPNLDDFSSSSFFDMRNSCFTPMLPGHSQYLIPSEASKLPLLLRMNYDTMYLFSFTRSERDRCLELISDYYRLHIADFAEIKSYEILKEVFS